MPTDTLERAEEIIAGWRRGEDVDGQNPAGPLFTSGDFAEYEITMTGTGTDDPTFLITGCCNC
jgi:hypothetical protein